MKLMREAAEEAGLLPCEMPRMLYLTTRAFSSRTGLATPTSQLRRTKLRRRFLPRVLRLLAEASHSKARAGLEAVEDGVEE